MIVSFSQMAATQMVKGVSSVLILLLREVYTRRLLLPKRVSEYVIGHLLDTYCQGIIAMICEAKERISRLRRSIKTFQELRDSGEPFPSGKRPDEHAEA